MEKNDKLRFLSRDGLKYLAIVLMAVGHIGWVYQWMYPGDTFQDHAPLWYALLADLSLFCPPIMFSMVGDGWKYSRNRKKYGLRLLICAAVTEVFIIIAYKGWDHTNVIFTLLVGLIEISVWESQLKRWKKVLIIALLMIAGILLKFEWCFFGDLFILFRHVYRDQPKKRFISYTAVALSWGGLALTYDAFFSEHFLMDLLNQSVMVGAIMLSYFAQTRLCNGKKGRFPKFSKWFFYIFYPAHILLIYLFYLIFLKQN